MTAPSQVEDAKAYWNNTSDFGGSGTYGAPDWVELDEIMDLQYSDIHEKNDVTTRASRGKREYSYGLQDLSVSFKILWAPSDAGFVALHTAKKGKIPIEMAFTDDDILNTGTLGSKAHWIVDDFSKEEVLGGSQVANVSLSPAKNSNSPPEDIVVS